MITVEQYNPEWAVHFETMKKEYNKALEGCHITIEHVGSTSVVGLRAKPILDMDIVMWHKDEQAILIERLAKLGYKHLGDLGITGREAFKKSESVPTEMAHNLYVCDPESIAFKNHIALRDYLRKHPSDVEAYGALKEALAKQYPDDIDAYCEAKTDFITALLQKAGMSINEVATITTQNRL